MGVYRYRAVHADGRIAHGEMIADSEVQVRAMLRTAGLLPHRIAASPTSRRARSGAAGPRWRTPRRTAGEGSEFFEGMSALLTAGVPLTEGLETLARQRRRTDRAGSMLLGLAERVRSGDEFADALAEFPEWFTPIEVELVRVATQSGELARAMQDLARDRRRRADLMHRIIGALAYPALLIAFGIGVVAFLTTTTLPQLATVLGEGDVPLPASTEALLAIGRVLTDHTMAVLAAIGILSALAVTVVVHPSFSGVRLRVPVLGPLARRAQIATACGLLARLLRGGIQFTGALRLIEPTIRNTAVRRGLSAFGETLHSGGSMRDLPEGFFEPVVERLLRVGDESGELAEALDLIAQRESESITRRIGRLTAVLEPTAILFVAALVGFVVLAALTPMLRLTQTL